MRWSAYSPWYCRAHSSCLTQERSYMKGPNLFPLVSHLAFSQHSLQCREILGIQLLSNSAWNVCLLSCIVSEGEPKGMEQNVYLCSGKKGQGSNSSFPGPSISVHSNPKSNQTNASTSTASLCLQLRKTQSQWSLSILHISLLYPLLPSLLTFSGLISDSTFFYLL